MIVRIRGYWGYQQGEILTDVRIMGSLRGRSKGILMVVGICRGKMPDGRPSGGLNGVPGPEPLGQRRVGMGVIQLPVVEIVEIARHLGDHAAQFQRLQPFGGNGALAIQGAQQVAGDGTGGIGIAVVIDGQLDAMLEILCHQRTVQADGQCLFGNPALAEPRDGLGVGQVGTGQGLGLFDGVQGFLVIGGGAQQGLDGRQTVAQRHAAGQPLDEHGQGATGELAGGMPMGETGQPVAQLEGLLWLQVQAVRKEPHRRHAHHAAAALAVVAGRRAQRVHAAQAAEAGHAGGSTGMQRFLGKQPAVQGRVQGKGRRFALRLQPVQVGQRRGSYRVEGMAVGL